MKKIALTAVLLFGATVLYAEKLWRMVDGKFEAAKYSYGEYAIFDDATKASMIVKSATATASDFKPVKK